MPHPADAIQAVANLEQSCDFSNPRLGLWRQELITAIQNHANPDLLSQAFIQLCNFLSTFDRYKPGSSQDKKILNFIHMTIVNANPISFIEANVLIYKSGIALTDKQTNLFLTRTIENSDHPLALAKAILFGARLGLILNGSKQAPLNYQKLQNVANSWFNDDDTSLRKIFDSIPSDKFTQELFNNLCFVTPLHRQDPGKLRTAVTAVINQHCYHSTSSSQFSRDYLKQPNFFQPSLKKPVVEGVLNRSIYPITTSPGFTNPISSTIQQEASRKRSLSENDHDLAGKKSIGRNFS